MLGCLLDEKISITTSQVEILCRSATLGKFHLDGPHLSAILMAFSFGDCVKDMSRKVGFRPFSAMVLNFLFLLGSLYKIRIACVNRKTTGLKNFLIQSRLRKPCVSLLTCMQLSNCVNNVFCNKCTLVESRKHARSTWYTNVIKTLTGLTQSFLRSR